MYGDAVKAFIYPYTRLSGFSLINEDIVKDFKLSEVQDAQN